MSLSYRKFVTFLGTKRFFQIILAIFLIESSWVAVSAKFPMAFDEGFHFALIKMYASHIGPLYLHQPAGAATYGALTHDTSFIYHYLMSFPYRLVSLWTQSLMIHVIVLRLIDVLLFAISLVLIRKILLKTKASAALVNMSLLFFILIPIVPLLAGQVSYDDGLIPVTALTLLLTINFAEDFKKHKRVNFVKLIVLYSLCLLSSMVKFPYLPILTGITLYLIYLFWRVSKYHPHHFWSNLRDDWAKLRLIKRSALVLLLLFSVGLWIDIYGVNIWVYKNPVAQCGQILGDQRCQAFAPWARNFADASYNNGVDVNPLRFSASWIYGMFDRAYFTINGPGGVASNDNHLAPVVSITAAVIGGIGILLFLFRYGYSILSKDAVLGFMLYISLFYIASLWGRNYHDYLNLGQIVAINGRYLIPIMAPIYLAIAICYDRLLGSAFPLKAGLLAIVFLLFLEGGGAIGFIYYSNSHWYWPGDRFAKSINAHARDVIKPLFIARNKS